ncbi:MAG: hypothetical protein GEU28_07925 [Dehalococcoidia bacterium]|nr:hypothetical protein [Dehalococcoidia bacterium]
MTADVVYAKPLPSIDAVSAGFWSAAREGRFVLYRCDDCGRNYYPATLCTQCSSNRPSMRWVDASGKGRLFSWIVMHRLYHPAFETDIPYNIAIVELDEGPFYMTNLVDCSDQELYSGMPLEVTFERATDDISLPHFRPAPGRGESQ